MPRRGTEVAQLPMPPKKKTRLVSEAPVPSLDISFFDDEALPPGIVFNDLHQKKWRTGKPIGRGSFGRIYLASDEVGREVTQSNARYVVKIEPHTNGPLFVEIHCLIRSAQVSNVQEWRKKNKLKRLGMPLYISSGSFTDENTGTKYRFLVLPRYDIDLQKIIARTRVLDLKNVLVLAIQILDVLEYLHDKGYTHSDIKSSNLMLGFDGGKLGKGPVIKSNPTSFQKETKEVAVLSGKHRKVKTTKSRSSNYYDDEDFVVNKNLEDGLNNPYNTLDNVRKIRKILSDKDSRSIHRHHAFNLRQLSSCVNYEDMSSSVCSDQSYQKLLDDFGNMRSEFLDEVKNADMKFQNGCLDEVHKEAVLSQSNGQIYLLDYGLASKFLDSQGKHKEFAMDARKAHDGTLEYSSRDSHIGAHSRRSDLETLGYNLLDWLTGTLPWKTTEVLAEPEIVHALKNKFMGNVQSLLKACFKTEFYPQFMEKYLEYVTKLNFTEKPDYDYCRSLFKSELLKGGYDKDAPLNFVDPPMSPMHRKLNYAKKFGRTTTPKDFLSRNGSGLMKAFERENVYSLENDLKLELLKQTLNSSSDGIRKPCASRNFFISDADLVARLKKSLMPHDVFGKKLSPKNLRSTKKLIAKRRGLKRHRNSIGKFGNFMGSARQFTWAEILAGNPEDIIRKERNVGNDDDDDESNCKYRIRKLSNASSESNDNSQSPLLQKDYLQDKNPTAAMKEVIANLKKRIANKNMKDCDESLSIIEGYTAAMVKVYKAKEKREAKEKQELAKQTEKKEIPVRATRSGRTKIQNSDTEVIDRKTRANKKKPSVDSKEEIINTQDVAAKSNEKEKPKSRNTKKKTSVDSKEEINTDEATVQNNEKVIPKCTRTVTRKEVNFEIPKKMPVKNSKKTPSKIPTVPNNRRRLRSSKRVK